MSKSNKNHKYVSEGEPFNNLDGTGDYVFENSFESTIGAYINEAMQLADGSNDNIFSSSEYVKLEKDLYRENTYSLFEFDKLSINIVDYRASSATLYKYFNVLKPKTTYQLTTSEAISIDGLYFAIEGEDGVKEKTTSVKIVNPENDGKHFVITTPADKTTYFYGRFAPVYIASTNLKVKLEIGHNPTPWTPSINDISNAILENNKANDKNSKIITDLKNSYYKFITTTFNEEVTNIAEVKSIEVYVNGINGMMAGIKASYDTIEDSPYLFNTNEKRALIRDYSELVKAKDDLIKVINGVMGNNKLTPTDKDNINIAFDDFNQSIYNYQISYEKAKNLINIGIYKKMLYEALGDGNIRMEIYAPNFGIIIDDLNESGIILEANVFKYYKTINNKITKWEWSRDTHNINSDSNLNDIRWNDLHKDVNSRKITISGEDLAPSLTTFICVAYSDDAELQGLVSQIQV